LVGTVIMFISSYYVHALVMSEVCPVVIVH